MARINLTREDILFAMSKTTSNRSASKFLGIDFLTYKKYALLFKDDLGRTLYDIHKNPTGVGIPKGPKVKQIRKYDIYDILDGTLSPVDIDRKDIIRKLIDADLLRECCSECGYQEKRLFDSKAPLILFHKDGNTFNYGLKNIKYYCYNCYFLHVEDLLNKNSMKQLQELTEDSLPSAPNLLEIDSYHIERLKQLGIYDSPKVTDQDDDAYKLVSRKI